MINNLDNDPQNKNQQESYNPPIASEWNVNLEAVLSMMDTKLGTQDILLKSVIKELDLFLYRAAHDLRRPVAAIMGLTNLMRQASNPDEHTEYLARIEETCSSMDRLLTKLRMVGDIQEDELIIGKVNFERMIKHIRTRLSDYIDMSQCIMNIDIQEESPFMTNDTLVFSILYNILENAIQYRKEEKAHIEIKYHSIIHQVIIQIKDYGVGIPLEEQGKIFDMFYKASEASRGSGLGLYIVRRAIKRLGGLLKLKSEFNEYTFFEIILPNKAYLHS